MAKSSVSNPKKIAIIGAGWAGCAAAVHLAKAGHEVSLLEAAKTLGGRARGVFINDKQLDNGQHILLGAYKASLDLCQQVGIDTKQALLRLPLQMCYPNPDMEKTGQGMHFVAPRLPAPLHLLIALLRAKGLAREDKMALARFSTTARWMDWKLHQDCSVNELLSRFDQTDNLCKLMWHPLCIAALNTPPERASAQVFLNVLRDSLGAKRAASDMLIPRVDLSALMPNAAASFIQARSGQVITGCTVQQINQNPDQRWQIHSNQNEAISNFAFDAIIIATNPEQASQILNNAQINQDQLKPTFDAHFSYEPITTCYLQYEKHIQLPRPFYALIDEPSKSHWGQFVFDRGQLHADQAGLLAVVVSASSLAIEQSHEDLAQAIAKQLASSFQLTELETPLWQKTITEKRATFACSPALVRPSNVTSIANLMIAGDYTQGDYPATLEAAVQSGIKAAQTLLR